MEEARIVKDCEASLKKYHRLMYQSANERLDNRLEDVEDAIVAASVAFLVRCWRGDLEDRGIGAFLLLHVRTQCRLLIQKRVEDMRWVRSLETGNPYAEAASGDERIPDLNSTHRPEAALEYSLLSEDLARCLEELSPVQRQGILLHVRGISDAEIAEAMKAPLGTAKTRLSAARKRLRVCLHDKGHSL